jgi:hypothetical protein
MNTQENNIPLLQEVLEQYQNGTLDMTQKARKCYMSEKEKHYGRVEWIHNDNLQGQLMLRGMAKQTARDLLRNK